MAVLPPLDAHAILRVRRWDVVVLGGALPGLIAAVRLGMRGQRVLVLEEDTARAAYPGLREPFLMTGSGSEGVLGACLVAMKIPLIERRRIQVDPLAFQVALPDARVDIGEPAWTVEELESWGLAPHGVAEELVESLLEQSAAEADAMLRARLVQSGRGLGGRAKELGRTLRASAGSSDSPDGPRADSCARATATCDRLGPLLDAQVHALSDATHTVPARARTRLLGSALRGAAVLGGPERWLGDLLRRRIEALFGELRSFGGGFELVSAGNLPGVALEDSANVCAGRALVINAPLPALRAASVAVPAPALLDGPPPTHRRHTIHLRGRRTMLPEGMAPRLIWAAGPKSGPEVVSVRVYGNAAGDDVASEAEVDVVATAVAPIGEDTKRVEDAIMATVARLSPLTQEAFSRVRAASPLWDCDDWLGASPDPASWPEPVVLRPYSRLPAYVLDRGPLAPLGFEGDLHLGWQAGDAIADDLA